MTTPLFLFTFLGLAGVLIGFEGHAYFAGDDRNLITNLSKTHWYLRGLFAVLFAGCFVWWLLHTLAVCAAWWCA